MVEIQNLEFELQNLFKEKKYSEIIFEITSKTKEEDRNAGLFVLLGISRMSLGKKDKNQVSLAVSDFKKGYLKEKESVNGLNALTNFIVSSSILSDFTDSKVDFEEIKNFYKSSPKPFNDQRPINIAMSSIYSRFSDYKGMLFFCDLNLLLVVLTGAGRILCVRCSSAYAIGKITMPNNKAEPKLTQGINCRLNIENSTH